jgi:hypothetical protein
MQIDPELEAKMIALGAKVTYHGRSTPGAIARKAKPKAAVKLIAPAFEVGFDYVQFTLALKLESASTNRGAFNKAHLRYPALYRWAWFSVWEPRFEECLFVRRAAVQGRNVYVTITRLGREMDDDNLRTAAKPLRDAIALGFGLKDDPKGLLKWGYGQQSRMYSGAVVRLSLEP